MRHCVHKEQSLRRFGHPREYTKRCRCLTFPGDISLFKGNKSSVKRKIPSRTQCGWEFLCFANNQSVYRCADADVVACVTNNKRVPLSRCTFFPADMITAPSAAFDAFAFKVSPLRP